MPNSGDLEETVAKKRGFTILVKPKQTHHINDALDSLTIELTTQPHSPAQLASCEIIKEKTPVADLDKEAAKKRGQLSVPRGTRSASEKLFLTITL